MRKRDKKFKNFAYSQLFSNNKQRHIYAKKTQIDGPINFIFLL